MDLLLDSSLLGALSCTAGQHDLLRADSWTISICLPEGIFRLPGVKEHKAVGRNHTMEAGSTPGSCDKSPSTLPPHSAVQEGGVCGDDCTSYGDCIMTVHFMGMIVHPGWTPSDPGTDQFYLLKETFVLGLMPGAE